jgi:hypothetical protein
LNLKAKLGPALVCLFALPFAGFGLFALKESLRLALGGEGNQPFWYPLIFGVVFSGIGFGLISLVIFGSRWTQRQQRVQAEHPAEPWLWRADWAQGRANSRTRNDMRAAWVFGILWNLVSLPVAFLVGPQAVREKGPIALLAWIFPVAGVWLLIRAIRETIAYFEFGNTWFEMSSVPGVVGRELKGEIHARFPHSPDHGIHLRLSTVNRVVTGSGKSQNTIETILWRDEADVSSAQLYPGPTGTIIPVCFQIPADAHPTEKISPRDEFLWLLEALADVPGVDYHDVFEVPVFRTQQSPASTEAAKTRFEGVAHTEMRPASLSVQVRENAEGTEFYFAAGRNKGFAASLTFFLAIFGLTTLFLIWAHVLLLFPLIFGFFSLVLLYLAVQQWFGTTRVMINRTELTLQSGLLGSGVVRHIALEDIAAFSDRITAQQGGATGTPYYDVELTLKDGKKLTLGSTLPNKREAEWLSQEMQRLTGLRSQSATAGA